MHCDRKVAVRNFEQFKIPQRPTATVWRSVRPTTTTLRPYWDYTVICRDLVQKAVAVLSQPRCDWWAYKNALLQKFSTRILRLAITASLSLSINLTVSLFLLFKVCTERRNWTELWANGRVQYSSVQLRRSVRVFTLNLTLKLTISLDCYFKLPSGELLRLRQSEFNRMLIVKRVKRLAVCAIDVKNIDLEIKNIKTCFFTFIKNIIKHP